MGHKGNEKISDKLEIPCRSSHSFAYSWQICYTPHNFLVLFVQHHVINIQAIWILIRIFL